MDSVKRIAAICSLAALYFVAGKLGLRLAFVNASATAVWPPTGIALACFLLWGFRLWPAIFAGAFLVNLTTAGSIATSAGIALGNTLEGVVGAYLVRRFAAGLNAFDRPNDVFKFALLSGMLSTTVSASIGVTTLLLGGYAVWGRAGAIWLTWWLGDAGGDLLVAPLIVLWVTRWRLRWNRAQFSEAAILLVCVILVGRTVFGNLFHSQAANYPLEFLCFPFLVWTAFRFTPCEAASVTFLLSGIATWGTLHGAGPFVRPSENESLLFLQAFMGVTAVMTLALAAVVMERRRAEEQLRQLAVTEPVTGLANYRRFVEALNAEINRSGRTGAAFALLVFDLDGLKRINDTFGHLVGTRALCRLALILRESCRAVDTASRLGGDEFAVLLFETGGAEADRIARRVRERLADDGEKPPLSVSVGFAVYPRDGQSAETLLTAADRALYDMKALGGPQ